MGKWAMTLGAWVATSLWLPAVQAEDNLYFSGTLVNEPCVLVADDELFKLDFQTVINKDLYLNGRTPGLPIDLRLTNCDMDVGKRMVSITLSANGNESTVPPGLLVLESSTVQGLLVGLETTGGIAMPLNKPHRMGELSSGDNVISFKAYLQGEPEVLANRTLGLGDFKGSLTFGLSYE